MNFFYKNICSIFFKKVYEKIDMIERFFRKRIEVIHLHLMTAEDLELDRESPKKLSQKDCDTNCQTMDFSCYKSGAAFLDSCYSGICDGLFFDVLLDGISEIEVTGKVQEILPFSRSRTAKVHEAFSLWLFSRSRKGGWV